MADRHPGETVLLVAHGGILTLLVRGLLTFHNSVTPRAFVNCGYAETELGADGWRLTGWSAHRTVTGHWQSGRMPETNPA